MNIFRLLTIRGIPVFVSPTYFLLLLSRSRADSQILLWPLAITASLLVHELGHALTARRLRHEPSILLHGFGSVTSLDRVGGWVEEALIIAMGPACSLALTLVLFGVFRAVGSLGLGNVVFSMTLYSLIYASFLWALVNLLPVWPYDGGHLLHLCLARWLSPQLASRVTYLVSLTIVVSLATYGARQQMLYSVLLALAIIVHNVHALWKGLDIVVPKTSPVGLAAEVTTEVELGLPRPTGSPGHDCSRLCWLLGALAFIAVALTITFTSPLTELIF